MCLLLMILLNVVPGLDKSTVLNTFSTVEECQIERDRIGFAMAEAYPYARDFVIVCQLSSKHDA